MENADPSPRKPTVLKPALHPIARQELWVHSGPFADSVFPDHRVKGCGSLSGVGF